MKQEKQIEATEQDVGKRADIFLSSSTPDFSRSKVKNLIIQGNISLLRDNKEEILSDISLKVRSCDTFIIRDIPVQSELVPKKMDIEILFEDDYLLVINKPAGLVVHPGAGNFENTLVNGLLYKYENGLSSINGDVRPGIVHRLDKDTSGVLVVAKDDKTHALLAKQFEEHTIERNYRALVWGRLRDNSGSIETYIKRSDANRLKMAISSKGKLAQTDYALLDDYLGKLSLVKLTLHTGRTHQIRVHMSSLGHPVVADDLYGSNLTKYFNTLDSDIQALIKGLKRQALHAYRLGFLHPITEEYILIEKEEPKELLDLYNKIGFNKRYP